MASKNITFEHEGKTYDTSKRTAEGQSAREYWSSITGQDKSKYPGSSSSVSSKEDADRFVNQSDTMVDTTSGAPEIRKSYERTAKLAEEELGFGISDLERPELPSFEETYTKLREQSGITGLEAELNKMMSQADTLKTQFYINKNAEETKSGLVAQNVVSGRVGEHEKAFNERIMILNDQINTTNNQIQTAYNVINTTMQYKQMDYNAAVQDYDQKFNSAMTMMNVFRGIEKDIDEKEARAKNEARANLQIMYNNIAEHPDGVDSLNSQQKTAISKLETQAGLPSGTYELIQSKNPGGQILSTSTRTDGDNQYSDIIMMGKDGKPYVESMYIGQARSKPKAGAGASTEAKYEKLYKEQSTYAEGLIREMRNDGASWGDAWGAMKRRYPELTTQQIDFFLDYESNYDQYK